MATVHGRWPPKAQMACSMAAPSAMLPLLQSLGYHARCCALRAATAAACHAGKPGLSGPTRSASHSPQRRASKSCCRAVREKASSATRSVASCAPARGRAAQGALSVSGQAALHTGGDCRSQSLLSPLGRLRGTLQSKEPSAQAWPWPSPAYRRPACQLARRPAPAGGPQPPAPRPCTRMHRIGSGAQPRSILRSAKASLMRPDALGGEPTSYMQACRARSWASQRVRSGRSVPDDGEGLPHVVCRKGGGTPLAHRRPHRGVRGGEEAWDTFGARNLR